MIKTGIGDVGLWLIITRRRTIIRREGTEAPLAKVSIEMENNREIEDNWFTPKKVLAYSIIIGLVSGTLSIFIN